jgi:hypothetical protein
MTSSSQRSWTAGLLLDSAAVAQGGQCAAVVQGGQCGAQHRDGAVEFKGPLCVRA